MTTPLERLGRLGTIPAPLTEQLLISNLFMDLLPELEEAGCFVASDESASGRYAMSADVRGEYGVRKIEGLADEMLVMFPRIFTLAKDQEDSVIFQPYFTGIHLYMQEVMGTRCKGFGQSDDSDVARFTRREMSKEWVGFDAMLANCKRIASGVDA